MRPFPASLSGRKHVEVKTYSADVSAQILFSDAEDSKNCCEGMYLTQVKALASVDDAMTITVADQDGTTLYQKTTTTATTGEFLSLVPTDECRFMTGNPKITVADMAASTVTLTFVFTG